MKKIFTIIFFSLFLFSCSENKNKEEKEISLFEKNKECFKLIKDFDFSKTIFYWEKDYFISQVFYSKTNDTCVLEVVHHFEKSPEWNTIWIGKILYDFIKYQELASHYSSIWWEYDEKEEERLEKEYEEYRKTYNEYRGINL